jgi:hypothetical protein
MKSTLKNLVVRSLLVAGFVLGAVQGCGSSGSSTPSCNDTCVKIEMCQADASTATATTACNQICALSAGGTSGQGQTCTNASAMQSAYNNCFSMTDCTAFNTCLNNVPKCQSGAGGAGGATGAAGKGAAGTNGAAGSTGAGGAGAADCSPCTRATSCCATAGFPAATCSAIPTTAACNSATGQTQTTDISTCQAILTGAAAQGITCP